MRPGVCSLSCRSEDSGFPGGQAEFVRVPFGDVNSLVIPDKLADEDVLFLSDVLPTSYHSVVDTGVEVRLSLRSAPPSPLPALYPRAEIAGPHSADARRRMAMSWLSGVLGACGAAFNVR